MSNLEKLKQKDEAFIDRFESILRQIRKNDSPQAWKELGDLTREFDALQAEIAAEEALTSLQ